MTNTRIEIPQALFAPAESAFYSGDLACPTFEAGPDTYTFAQPLHWQVTISNTGDALLVAGSVHAEGVTACGRCLEDVHLVLDGEIEGYYLLPGAQEPQDAEDDEFERLPEDNIIDLEPLIFAALLVEMPALPLCREDCKGICPDCGINLNEATCDCAQRRAQEWAQAQEAANPFAALRNLNLQ